METYSTDYSAPVTSITIGYEFYFQLMIVTRLKLYLRGLEQWLQRPLIFREFRAMRRKLEDIWTPYAER